MPRASHGTAASGNGNGDRQQTQQEKGKVRGMTDRDHFAAAALAGLLANPKNNDTTADTIRFWAWNWADAMLRERERCPARMEFPTPPGEGWRRVEPHEPLERGDQCWINDVRGWLPVTCYGDEWPIARQLFYRRRIDAKSNHDAAPAARAQLPTGDHASGGSGSVGTDNADPLTRWGTGDTQEPVAWGVATGGGVIATSISRIDAVDMQSDYECATEVVPLYRSPTLTATPPLHATHGACSLPPECTQPTLTDAEREAIGRDLDWLKWCEDNRQIGDVGRKDIATLRGLLERLG